MGRVDETLGAVSRKWVSNVTRHAREGGNDALSLWSLYPAELCLGGVQKYKAFFYHEEHEVISSCSSCSSWFKKGLKWVQVIFGQFLSGGIRRLFDDTKEGTS